MTCAECGKHAWSGYARHTDDGWESQCRPCWVKDFQAKNGGGNTYGNGQMWVHEADGSFRSLPLSGLGEVGRG